MFFYRMTHKRKRVGRPPGSKNKKTKTLQNIIKTEDDSNESTNGDNVCIHCSQLFDTKLILDRHLKTCSKSVWNGVDDVLKVRINSTIVDIYL